MYKIFIITCAPLPLNIRLVSGQTVSRCWSWVSIKTEIELIMYDLYMNLLHAKQLYYYCACA